MGDVSPNFVCTFICNEVSIYPCQLYLVRWYLISKQRMLPQMRNERGLYDWLSNPNLYVLN